MRSFLPLLVPYLFAGVGATAACAMFFMMKRELHRVNRRFDDLAECATHELERLQAEADGLRRETKELGELRPVAALPNGPLNRSKRTQVLRLARKGEQPERIANALAIPKGEVKLLLRIQEVVSKAS